MGKDSSRQFDTHADVHAIAFGLDIQGITNLLHPLATASSGRDDAVGSFECFAFDRSQMIASFTLFDGIDMSVEEEIGFFLELVV